MISARYDCHSRDMDQVSLYFRPHFGAKRIGSAQVDRPAERVLQVKLQPHEPVKRGFPLEGDEDIDVAALAIVAPGD